MRKKSKRRKLLCSDVILWLSFFIVIGSACFQFQYEFPLLFTFFGIFSKVVFVVSLLAYIRKCIKRKIRVFTEFDVFLLLFFLWLIYASVLNGNSWILQVPFVMKTLAIRYLFSLYVFNNNTERWLEILSSVFSFIVYANFFQLLCFSTIMGSLDGEEIYLITTNYNQFGAVFLPALFLKIIEYFRTGHMLSLFLLFLVCLISVALEGSVTSAVSILLLLITVLFVKRESVLKLENISILVGIVCFFFTFVVSVFSILNVPFVGDFVERLGKDMTFSNRVFIWELAELNIARSPLIGYGVCDKELFQDLLGNAVNAHNVVLHVLMQGGVIGLILFAIFVYVGFKQVLSIENVYCKYLIINVSLAFFLMSQFEVYTNTFIYMFVFFMFVSKDIVSKFSKYV